MTDEDNDELEYQTYTNPVGLNLTVVAGIWVTVIMIILIARYG